MRRIRRCRLRRWEIFQPAGSSIRRLSKSEARRCRLLRAAATAAELRQGLGRQTLGRRGGWSTSIGTGVRCLFRGAVGVGGAQDSDGS